MVEKKQLHQDISFRIKIGEKLNNSPISGRAGYDLTQKSKGQQTFGKTHYFTTTDCCPNVYRNPIRATSNEICFWGRPLQKCVLLCKHLIKKRKKTKKKPQVQNWNRSEGSPAIVIVTYTADHIGNASLPASLFSDWHHYVCCRTWCWCHTSCPSEFCCLG